MGVIQRQGLKTTIVHFLSAVIGGISILFIYPLNDEYYGFAQWLYNTAFLLVPIASFGISSVVIKYFPIYSKTDKINYNGFLTLVFTILSLAYIAFLFVWFLFRDVLIRFFEWLDMDPEAIIQNEWAVLLLLYFLVISFVLVNHSANRLRIVVPNILNELGFKIFLPVLILVTVHYGMTKSEFSFYIVLFFGVVTLLMLIYLKYLGVLRFSRIKRPTEDFSYKSMFSFGLFGSLNTLSSSLAFRIDTVMIPFLEDMLRNGYYNKVLFISNALEMPNRAINQIAAPIISKAWAENDTEEIQSVYTKASTNLFLIGAFMFILIWFILDDLILISANPDSFPFAREIFLFLAMSKLFNMMTSVNSQIIVYSRHYRINLLFLSVLAVMNVVLNYIFIKEYGIVGAAIATALSVFVFNLLKFNYVYFKYRMHPFSISTLKTVIIIVLFIVFYRLIDIDLHPIAGILIKGILISVLFGLISFFWKISPELNKLAIEFIKKRK